MGMHRNGSDSAVMVHDDLKGRGNRLVVGVRKGHLGFANAPLRFIGRKRLSGAGRIVEQGAAVHRALRRQVMSAVVRPPPDNRAAGR